MLAALPPPLLDWRTEGALGLALSIVACLVLIRWRHRPFFFALSGALLEVSLLVAMRGLLTPLRFPIPYVRSYALVIVPIAAASLILTWQRWWPSAGFTGPYHWRRARLLWLVVAFAGLPALIYIPYVHPVARHLQEVMRVAPALPFVLAGYTVLATGLEEMFYRGIVLRVTIRYGVLPAVLFSSLLFGLSHVNNLFGSFGIDPLYVLNEAWFAFLIGIFLAAIRLRTNAIWPAMAAHAGYDLPATVLYGAYAFAGRPTLESFGIWTGFGLFFAGVGWFLLRKAKPDIIPVELKT